MTLPATPGSGAAARRDEDTDDDPGVGAQDRTAMTAPAPPVPPAIAELDRLRDRVAALEADHRRAFDQAQREADALFAQYQLSQLIASGGTPAELGRAFVVELVRLAAAVAGAIWLGDAGRPGLRLLAATGPFDGPLPERVADIEDARAFAAGRPDLRLVVLGAEPPALLVVLRTPPDGSLDADGLRVAQLARHELAVAFGGAQLREALERERHDLEAVVDGATDAILQVDEARRVVRLNPAAERMLGIDARDAIGPTCDEILGCVATDGHDAASCPLAEVIATGSPIGYRESVVRPARGGRIQVAGAYSRAPSQAGSALRATAILRDVTAVHALEELRDSFVATVSHELRTPLALVRGYAESVLLLDLDPARQREYVDRIHQVTTRLGRLVDQILDVTHLDADPLILERAPVLLGALLARLRGDLAVTGDDARLRVELPADLPPIEVDAGRIGQVLSNLVGNALKYAPSETSVVVGATVDGERVVVTVDDQGVGIPADERPLVGEPFHRASNVRESRFPGTGLGVTISRRLVEAHGGRLWLADRPDGRPGTRVSFSLPILPGVRQSARAARRG